MTKLTGLIAAPHTPFDANGEVNYPVIDRIAEHLIAQGVKGAYVCGTTGEGIHCSVEERKKIAERWVAASQGQLSITLHTGALSIADALELSRHAETLDIFATSVIGPCFFKPSTVDDLVEYCRIIAAAAPSKGFYYYHSGMSGLSLDMEQFLIAAADKIPNLSGMKFNSADMYEFQRCLRVNNRQFDIPFGVDEFLPAGLACGAVADDAPHPNGHALIEDMHVVAAMRQTRAGAFQRARGHTRNDAQAAKVFRRRYGINQGVITQHGGIRYE